MSSCQPSPDGSNFARHEMRSDVILGRLKPSDVPAVSAACPPRGRGGRTMVRTGITRLVSAAGTLAITAALAIGLAPGTAQAAPKPKPAAKPTSISITGKDVSSKILVQQQG